MRHLAIPGVEIEPGFLISEHEAYLHEWLIAARENVESGHVSASMCLQAAFIELVTAGHLETDWLGVFDAYLTDELGGPLAYSEAFGTRLYKFADQWKQSTVHAAHTRWWLENATGGGVDHGHFADMLAPKENAGWIYDHDVSPTIERHRMKSELTQSMAEAVEILEAAGALAAKQAALESTLVNFPQSGYVSAEYFRLEALKRLGGTQHMPSDTSDAIVRCLLETGVCDFSLVSKTDAYMGTAKRTARDKMLPSPLSTRQAEVLREVIADKEASEAVDTSVRAYGVLLKAKPLEIPAFQMRDVPIPFGADRTPIEVICASGLIRQYGGGS
jgi:hypothetical protein